MNSELFDQYAKHPTIELRNKIVEENLYMVDILIRKYLGKGVDYDDLYQVGALALVSAVERFDPSKGYEFKSFATPTILGEIKKYFRDKQWSLKVPRRLKEITSKVYEVKSDLASKLGRAPSIEEIAEVTGYSREQIMQSLESSKAYVLLGEGDALAVLGHDDHLVGAGSLLDTDELVVFLEIHGDEAGLSVGIKVGKRGLLDDAVLGHADKELVLRKLLDRNNGGDALSLHEIEEVDSRRPLGGPGCLRNLVSFDLMRFSCIGKEHQVIMRRGHDQVLDEIVLAGGDAGDALAASSLRPVGISRYALDIAKVRQRHADVLLLDEVFLVKLLGGSLDLGLSLVAPLFLDFQKLVLDYAHQLMLVGEQLGVVATSFSLSG